MATLTALIHEKIGAASAGEVPVFDGSNYVARLLTQVLAQAEPLGYEIDWLTTSTLRVRAGSWWTRDGLSRLALAANRTLGITTGADLDTVSLAGTWALNGTTTATGTGSNALTAFAPNGVPRALTGTGSTSGTTLTMTGGLSYERCTVDDLLGNETYGYSRVVSTNRESGQLVAVLADSLSIPAGQTINVIENPTVSINGQIRRVSRISNNNSITVTSAFSGTSSGHTATAGVVAIASSFVYLWATAADARLSTQYTGLLNAGAARLIGFWGLNSSALLSGGSPERKGLSYTLATRPATIASGTTPGTTNTRAAVTTPPGGMSAVLIHARAVKPSAAANDGEDAIVIEASSTNNEGYYTLGYIHGNDLSEHRSSGSVNVRVPLGVFADEAVRYRCLAATDAAAVTIAAIGYEVSL